MEKITAVLIDTMSIQQYIFSSNKLRLNVGASYIIENVVYDEILTNILSGMFNNKFSNNWKQNPNDIAINKTDVDCEIGYIGGGNALVLFKKKNDVTKFIKEYTLCLLARFPGLRTAFGITEDFDTTENGFKASREQLNTSLIKNKSENYRNVNPFKPGIVEDCPLSNEAQEIKEKHSKKTISMSSFVKFDACEKAQNKIADDYKDVLLDKYCFTNEQDKLGQAEDKGYIAVVHIDGNGMGQRFSKCKDLASLRFLSTAVSEIATNSMKELIAYIVKLFETEKLCEKNGFTLKESDTSRKKILPIRPIIVGGDDITFVCEGRLGVHLAEKFMKIFTQKDVAGGRIAACAGVAVVHTKYPFYKAYTLAEELTRDAKNASRDNNNSWLSFLISSSGFTGELEGIMAQKFNTMHGNMYNGPYRIDGENSTLKELKNSLKILINGDSANELKKWPKSKLMELRDVLRQDKPSQDYFLADMEARDRKLPQFSGTDYNTSLWVKNKTPFYDIIELNDFYPKELL